MRNIPIVLKFLTIMAAFGALMLAIAVFSGYHLAMIDKTYSGLLRQETAAALSSARANRAFQSFRAGISEIILLTDGSKISAAKDSLEESRRTFDRFLDEAISALPGDPSLPALKSEAAKVMDKTCASTLERGLQAGSSKEIAAIGTIFAIQCQPQFISVSSKMTTKVSELQNLALDRGNAASQHAYYTIWETICIIGLSLALVLPLGFVAMKAWIVSPLNRLQQSMLRLADGNLDVIIDGRDRKDEVGAMASAVQIFKEKGVEARGLQSEAEDLRVSNESERQRAADAERRRSLAMSEATASLAEGLRDLAAGKLSMRLNREFAPELESLRADFNSAIEQLGSTISNVAVSSQQFETGTREIRSSADDLSKRTEQQAASLEQTAAALDEITANLGNSSKRTDEARTVAEQARDSAVRSATIVSETVEAMRKIQDSSNQISNIIGVIDEIAFQTNLLALNAGVEAARAGEAGKGFAVVAQEVRELAQRSAQAAKEIKGLIHNSSGQVQNGVKLVSATGTALQAIESHVVLVHKHMEAIATSTKEQSIGLAEVNTAVNQMDQVTQQNAAMVEQSTAAAVTLAHQAEVLRELVAQFEIAPRDKRASVSASREPLMRLVR